VADAAQVKLPAFVVSFSRVQLVTERRWKPETMSACTLSMIGYRKKSAEAVQIVHFREAMVTETQRAEGHYRDEMISQLSVARTRVEDNRSLSERPS
jgi:hypothetical protein